MSDHNFDMDAELAHEAAMLEGETARDAIDRHNARHEAHVRGQLWGSDAGLSNGSDSASDAGPPRHPSNPHWPGGSGGMGRAGSHSGMEDSEAGHQHDGPREEDGNSFSVYRIAPQTCHVRYMPGFNELNGIALLGHGINMQPMIFDHSATNSTGWVRFDHAGVVNSAPVRAMVFNVPAECWSNDAAKFKDWQTPMNNALRVASIAALLGIVMTPLSKGFMSGNHEEEARANAQDKGNNGGGEAPRKPRDVRWYQMQSEDDHATNIPMLTIGYEDIYDSKKETVLAIRVWLFVFDKAHSTSDLVRRLMQENLQEAAHSGSAHCQNALRKTSAVQHAKQTRGLLGTSLAEAQLELVAGMCYRHVINVTEYKNLLAHYGGKTGDKPGRPPLDLTPDPAMPNKFPRGLLNSPFLPAEELGCTHPLAVEWAFNAKRPEALCAGLVHLDGTPMDVHPDQIAVTSYFDISAPANGDDTHKFTVPEWVGTDAEAGCKGCFFFQTDPHKLNIFDMVLPHAIAGAVKPGPALMRLFKERFQPTSELAESSPEMLNLFNNKMTGRDQWIMDQVASLTDTIVAYDTFDCTAEDRQRAVDAARAAKQGIASYGQMDGEDHVVEPRQVLKEHAFSSNNVHDLLVSPWASEQRAGFAAQEQAIRLADERKHAQTPISHAVFASLRAKKTTFEERHQDVMKEMILLHLTKMGRSFNSRMDKESIPAGYRAVWDGLQRELDTMPDRTANIAFGGMGADTSGQCGMQLSDSDRSVFAHMQNWMGSFFEDDCFVDGRDWRLMQELFYHCFEQFGEQTLLLIFCGPKGNGKTLRTERAMAAFVKGWITMSGPSSAKAGMQGNSDSSNGCNCIYDEMIDELTDGDGSNRTEYWKMILMKREYVYNKPVVVKGADGREMMKTFKLKTPHQETHCVCTNRGPAFTKGKEDPTEVKSALIDRAVVQFVRTLGSKTHDDQEFEKNLMNPEVKCKMRAFRIVTCLMGLLKLLIFRQPYLKPDMSLAQKLFDEWDDLLDRKYNLPRPAPRKNIKRIENLITMCCQNAIGHVFLYKQTAQMFEAGQTTAEYPMGKPFDLSMMYECVQLLQPTREMIHQAWCMGLEYSIGTSAMGFNTMSIVAELFGWSASDMIRRPPSGDYAEYLQDDDFLIDRQAEHEAQQKKDGTAVPPRAIKNKTGSFLHAFTPLFNERTDRLTPTEVEDLRAQLRVKREARVEYQRRCAASGIKDVAMGDVSALADDCVVDSVKTMSLNPVAPRAPVSGNGTAGSPMDLDVQRVQRGPHEEGTEDQDPGTGTPGEGDASNELTIPDFRAQGDDETMSEWEGEMPSRLLGNRLWTVHRQEPGSFSPGDREAFEAYHHARCLELPGRDNCPWIHADTSEMCQECCYCKSDLVHAVEVVDDENADMHLSLASSVLWPSLLEAAMFYKPQTLVQFAAGKAAYVGPHGAHFASSPHGPFEPMDRGNGSGGARAKDPAWYVAAGEQFKSWQSTASYIHNRGNSIVKEFDFHPDGLRDCLYMCSTQDNQRRCSEEPKLMGTGNWRQDNLKTNDNKAPGENTVVVKLNDYKLPGDTRVLDREHTHLPRNPQSRVPDSKFQRRLDSMFHGGKLTNLNVLLSNKVVIAAPLRMHQDGFAVNISALAHHVFLSAEAIYSVALLPGLKNKQEKFCNRQSGPAGLRAPIPTRTPSVGGKRTGEGLAKDPDDNQDALDSQLIHTLPYSYDLHGLSLGLDMLKMLYDDVGDNAVNDATVAFNASLGMRMTFDDLPHISMRYIGYDEFNRQTLSVKLKRHRPDGQDHVEAGDPEVAESFVSRAHVRRSLGREPTDSDIANFIRRKQGCRSMGGVRGDVFALSTWRKHTILTLRNRGLTRGRQCDTVVKCFLDMEHCIHSRIAEHASSRKLVTDDVDFASMRLKPAAPGTYEALEKQESNKRAAIDAVQVEQQIDDLGFSADASAYSGLVPSQAASRPGRDCINMAPGPEADD